MDFRGIFHGKGKCVHGVERKGRVLSLGKWERKGVECLRGKEGVRGGGFGFFKREKTKEKSERKGKKFLREKLEKRKEIR